MRARSSSKAIVLVVVFLSAQSISARSLPWSPLPKVAPAPLDNPTTTEKVHLGQKLFLDPRLSKDGTVSCNSCHNVMASGTDNRAISVGVAGKMGGRSAPTVWNAAFLTVQFWDGRAASLEEQAKGPLVNPIEMAMDNHQAVVDRIAAIPDYVAEFRRAFPNSPSLNIDDVARAIASYERTLITPNSPFDRYMEGDKSAISAQAERGMNAVITVGCTSCHRGPNFAGAMAPSTVGSYELFPSFENNDFVTKYRLKDDKGRGALTQVEQDDHYWRVPTWRNVSLTAPYFHNGAVPTLAEAVRVMAKTQLDVTLTEGQVDDIVVFLGTLNGDFPRQEMPRLPATPGFTLVPAVLSPMPFP